MTAGKKSRRPASTDIRILIPVAILVGASVFLVSRPSTPEVHIDLSHAPVGTRIPLSGAQAAKLSPPGGQPPVTSILNVRKRTRYGEFVWNDTGVAAGSAWVRIDLERQIISVFRAGNEIGTAVILYGADEKPTPTGRLTIREKLRDHRSNAYDAPMPYTMRLTDDGVAIHGSNVRWGAATHGCIGVPLGFAAKLFDQIKVGDQVLILPASPKPTQA